MAQFVTPLAVETVLSEAPKVKKELKYYYLRREESTRRCGMTHCCIGFVRRRGGDMD